MKNFSKTHPVALVRATGSGFSKNLLGRLARTPVSVFVVSLLVFLAHVLFHSEDYTVSQGILAGIAGVITLNVMIFFFRRREPGLPILEWAFFHYYIFFVMPVFMEGESSPSVSFFSMQRSGVIDLALLANIVLMVAVLVGWKVGKNYKNIRTSRKQSPPISIFWVVVYGIVSIGVTFFTWRNEVELKMEWYGYMLQVVFSPYMAQVLLLLESGKGNKRNARFILVLLTILMIVFGAFSSRLNYVLLPLVTIGIAFLAERGTISYRILIVGLVFLVLLNPAKHIYRSIVGYRTEEFAGQTIGEMTQAWQESLTAVWSSDSINKEQTTDSTASRFNYLNTNATVMMLVPERVPFEYGKPWRAIPFSLIPRFLWKEKPSLTVITSDYFAITMGLSTEEIAKRSTSAYPLVSDGYWNFGWAGVFLVGLIEGLLFAAISKVFEKGTRVRYTFALLYVAGLKTASPLAGVMTGIVQLYLVCFLVVKVLEALTSLSRIRSRAND